MKANKMKLNLDKMEIMLVGSNSILESGIMPILDEVALLLKDRVHRMGVLLDPVLVLDIQVVAVSSSAFHQLRLGNPAASLSERGGILPWPMP